MQMHHLMPNAIIQLSKSFWAIRTFNGPVSANAFCRYYELHPQSRKVSFEDDDKVYNAQSGCCTFVPRKGNNNLKLDRVEISHSLKNKWDDDWANYWFYVKIDFDSAESPKGVFFPSRRRFYLLNTRI